ncbi:MAG: glycosyltransferase family 39 protein [Pseudomonadota bacterium]
MNPNATLKPILLATLAIKCVLAWALPLSGDEAYFLVWARHLDFGYYDHPPMIGWILHLMLSLGNSELVIRLPAVMLSTLIGVGLYALLKPYDESRAALVAILFLVSPLNILNVLVTTDTPLILFVFASVIALFHALQKNRRAWYVLSGIFLGLAFLSKYFAVLLGLAYLAYFIFSGRTRQKMHGFLLLLLAACPFVWVNLYWNYTHCWDNLLFNLYNRNEDAQFSVGKIAAFLGMQIYLMSPPAIYYLFRHRAQLRQKMISGHAVVFVYAFLIPMAAFALLALKKDIGLHWVLAFYPFFYVLLYFSLTRDELTRTYKFMLWFSAAHLAAIAVIAALPMETWKHNKLYDGIVFMFDNDAIADHIRPYEQQQFLLAADGYTPAAIISYHYGKNFFVFGPGSRYARQDDIITDFRQFNRRNILIVRKSAPDPAEYAPYFNRVDIREFVLRGATFYLVLGYEFNFDHYKNQVLRPAREKYYRIPDAVPHAACYFCEKYFPDEASR